MNIKFAVAAVVLGSALIAAPGPAPAAPDHRGHGASAGYAGHRDRGHHRGPRGDHRRHGEHRRYGDYRRHGDRYRGGNRHHRDGYVPFSHHGYRKHYYGGHRGYGSRPHYRRYRHRGGHHYYAPGRHHHRHRPVARLYADYGAYFHCPAHGGYFLLEDIHYY